MLQLVGGVLFGAGLLGEGIFKITMFIRNFETFIRGKSTSARTIGYILMFIGLIGVFIGTAILVILTGYPISDDYHLQRKWAPRIPSPEEIAWWERFQQYLSESQSIRLVTDLLLLCVLILICGGLTTYFMPQELKPKISDALRKGHFRIFCLLSGMILYFFGYLLIK